MSAIGNRLKQARKSKNWTQEQLSKASKINVMAICHFECGRRQPRLPNAIKLCKALGCSLDWLVMGIDGSRSER